MKCLSVGFVVVMALAVAAPVAAWDSVPSALNDSQEPGSVLVFPYFETGTVLVPDQMGTAPNVDSKFPVTELVITATCPNGLACPFGTTVNLKAAWICPGPSSSSICRQTDFHLKVTVNGTISFDPEKLFDANVPNPLCPKGYLIVWVVDDPGLDNPIKFDSLLGNAVIRRSGGELFTTAAQYNAVPIQGGACCDQGGFTDQGNGHLVFDGYSYRQVTGTILGTVPYDKQRITGSYERQTYLRLLTLDVNAGATNPLTRLYFDFYKQNEEVESADGAFYCWFSHRLHQIDSNLTADFMGAKGLVVGSAVNMSTNDGMTLLGVIDTQEYDASGNIIREYISELSNNSVGVTTIFSPAGTASGVGP